MSLIVQGQTAPLSNMALSTSTPAIVALKHFYCDGRIRDVFWIVMSGSVRELCLVGAREPLNLDYHLGDSFVAASLIRLPQKVQALVPLDPERDNTRIRMIHNRNLAASFGCINHNTLPVPDGEQE
ncbi:hypothetical protein Moror_10068 [Moniliophthora roreri MCA 2997]|uniref:Uncharacterized protein n=1 Tax=Moniliophthora roreri (strain MCA 2997) TaxID=1381753 RepID=V2WVB5_MONRO|nr:hypothetical protein Moror_10068 [Moniliophthora roreri MCA 2997]